MQYEQFASNVLKKSFTTNKTFGKYQTINRVTPPTDNIPKPPHKSNKTKSHTQLHSRFLINFFTDFHRMNFTNILEMGPQFRITRIKVQILHENRTQHVQNLPTQKILKHLEKV